MTYIGAARNACLRIHDFKSSATQYPHQEREQPLPERQAIDEGAKIFLATKLFIVILDNKKHARRLDLFEDLCMVRKPL